jgi:hypothetical protein
MYLNAFKMAVLPHRNGLKSVATMCDGLKSIPTISVEPTALNNLDKTRWVEGCYKNFVAGEPARGIINNSNFVDIFWQKI